MLLFCHDVMVTRRPRDHDDEDEYDGGGGWRRPVGGSAILLHCDGPHTAPTAGRVQGGDKLLNLVPDLF